MLGTVIMMTLSMGKSYAFPLPTYDVSRIAQGVQVGMNQVESIYYMGIEIQQKIEEIRNGGFGGAARVLVGTIQNGDIDRYGNNIKAFGKNVTDTSYAVGDAFKTKEERQQAQEKRLEKQTEKAAAKKAAADAWAKQQTEKFEQTETQRKKKIGSIFSDSYNWLKSHRSTTDAIFSGEDAIKNKDIGGIVSSAGDVSGDSTLSILGHGIDNTYDNAKDGNWSGAIRSGANTVKGGADDAQRQYDKLKKQQGAE